jgi:DNA helicase IV
LILSNGIFSPFSDQKSQAKSMGDKMNNYIGRTVYNKYYGKGTIIDHKPATRGKHDDVIIIQFDTEIKTKTYESHRIGDVLFFEIPQFIIDRQNKENNQEYKKEFRREQSFLNSIFEKFKNELQHIEDSTFTNINSDFENIDDTISSDNAAKNTNKARVSSFMYDPFFAKIVYDGKTYYFSRKDNYGENIISTNNKQLYGRYINRKVELSNPEHKYSLIRDFVLLSPKLIEIIDTDLPYRKGNSDFNNYEAEFEKQQIEVIERQRTVKAVKDVIQTIDREQYDIISYDESKNVLVHGVAGSGKSYIISKRISYLFANDLDIANKNIKIITPTILLGNDIRSLIKEWGLEDIEIITYKKFLYDNYSKYLSKLNLTDINNLNPKELQSSTDNRLYSKKNIKRFLELVDDIVSKNLKSYLYKKFIEEFEKKLIDDLNVYTINPRLNLKELRNSNREYFELLELLSYAISQLAFEEVNTLSRHNKISKDVKVMLNKLLSSGVKLEGKYTNYTSKDEVNTQSYSRELTEVIDLFRIGQSPSFDWKNREELRQALIQLKYEKDENIERSNILNLEEMPSLLDRLYTSNYAINEQKKGVLEEVKGLISRRNTRNMIQEYLTKIHDKKLVTDLYSDFYIKSVNIVAMTNNYLAFKENDENVGMLQYIINFILFRNKQQFKLDQSLNYDFEVLYYLYVFNKYTGYVSDQKTILFMDEYQNLSASEICITRMMLNNLTLNLYGDKNQCTSNKEPFDISGEQNSWEVFNINKNYRNARKIVEYMNSRLNQSIESIDIAGNVEEITNLYQVNITIERDDLEDIGDRIAIIVKDFSLIDQNELISTDIPFKYIDNEETEIDRNTLNIIKPDLIKGLEFEVVIVYDKGLTFNERYIAYSRALKQLYVIK